MRNIVTMELDNGKVISIVGNGNKSKIKKEAIELSPRLIGDKSMYITKGTKITKVEAWETDSKLSYQNGSKQYMISFLFDNVTQLLYISSAGVKSAYNNIKIKFGIQENPFMIIYETTQHVKKKSAIEKSKNTYNNREKVHKLLKETHSKVMDKIELTQHKQEISLLLNMIKDSYNGKYKISESNLILIIACLIYFNEPYTTLQDIIRDTSDISDIAMMNFLLQTLKNQLNAYNSYHNKRNEKQAD